MIKYIPSVRWSLPTGRWSAVTGALLLLISTATPHIALYIYCTVYIALHDMHIMQCILHCLMHHILHWTLQCMHTPSHINCNATHIALCIVHCIVHSA